MLTGAFGDREIKGRQAERKGSKPDGRDPLSTVPPRGSVHESPVRRPGRRMRPTYFDMEGSEGKDVSGGRWRRKAVAHYFFLRFDARLVAGLAPIEGGTS